MKRSVMCLAIVAMVAVSPRTSAADEFDAQALYKKAVKSCVFIITPMKGGMGMGSGSLIDVEKRIVLTNYHVVDDREIVFVQFPMYQKNGEMNTDKEAYFANVPANKAIKGKVLHRDKSRDLAFVQIETIPPGTEALPLAQRSIGVGAPVWNIGSPGDVKHVFSVTKGEVRGVGMQKMDFGDQIVNAKFVTTTNPVNQGDSGGPLIDKRGYQVAVTQSIRLKAQLVSSFVDINEVRDFLSEKMITIKELGDAAVDKSKPKIDVEAMYKKAVGSTVYIIDAKRGSSGSGSLIDAEKKIVLTNFHVVDHSETVFVQFPMYLKDGSIDTTKDTYKANLPAGRAIKGTVMYLDKTRDLALILLERVPLGTEALPLAKGSVATGDTTWNIGCPGAVAQVFSITEGKVRSIGIENLRIGGGSEIIKLRARMVTTTNPANPGDSGGPLIDKRGYQVAVTQSINLRAQLVGKFVDISEVRAFLGEKKINIKELGDAAGDQPKPKEDPKLVAGPKKDETTPPSVEPKKDLPGTTATPDQEKDATELLRRSKSFSRGDDNRPTYVAKLQEIIKKYPGTAAAKDAKKVLDGLN